MLLYLNYLLLYGTRILVGNPSNNNNNANKILKQRVSWHMNQNNFFRVGFIFRIFWTLNLETWLSTKAGNVVTSRVIVNCSRRNQHEVRRYLGREFYGIYVSDICKVGDANEKMLRLACQLNAVRYSLWGIKETGYDNSPESYHVYHQICTSVGLLPRITWD